MKQFLFQNAPDSRGVVRLTGDDYHYLVRVRRISEGAVFKALLPDGAEIRALAQSITDNTLVCECLAPEERAGGSLLPPIALFQAMPKGAKIDQIVRQAAESGVSEIIPFVSAYSAPKMKEENKRAERWERIIKEARQQSGSGVETAVKPIRNVDAVFAYWESVKALRKKPAGILLHQSPLGNGSFHDCLKDSPDFIAAIVGPEGGFSGEEAERFMDAGFTPVVMGPAVLRVETAAVYAIAAIRIILLENEKWKPKIL
jgi:16S rRNA (uracil1498-N3)-methyltransferase